MPSSEVVACRVDATVKRLVDAAAYSNGRTKSRWAAEALEEAAIRDLERPTDSEGETDVRK